VVVVVAAAEVEVVAGVEAVEGPFSLLLHQTQLTPALDFNAIILVF